MIRYKQEVDYAPNIQTLTSGVGEVKILTEAILIHIQNMILWRTYDN